jgi:hypothetical protein
MAFAMMGQNLAVVAGAACVFGAGLANGHEHHTDNIPEGQAVSAEPLVWYTP